MAESQKTSKNCQLLIRQFLKDQITFPQIMIFKGWNVVGKNATKVAMKSLRHLNKK